MTPSALEFPIRQNTRFPWGLDSRLDGWRLFWFDEHVSRRNPTCTSPSYFGVSASPQPGAKGELTLLTYLDYDGPNLVFDDLLARCSESTGYTFKKLVVPQNELITKATQLTATGDAPAIIVADNNNVATLADIGLLSELSLEEAV